MASNNAIPQKYQISGENLPLSVDQFNELTNEDQQLYLRS